MLRFNSHTKAVLQALFVVFLWATSWVLIKIGLQDIPALTFAGLRYTLAFLCLLPLVFLSRQKTSLRKISKGTLWQLLVLGLLLYTITQGAIFLTLYYLPAVTVNLLWSFSTVMVALMGIIWLAENPTRFQWAGVLLATLGAVIYFYPATLVTNQLLGVLIAVVGVLANAGASILGRDVNRRGDIHPMTVTTISMGIGALTLLAVGITVQGMPAIPLRGWIIIAWLAVVNTAFAFTLWNHTLRSLSAMESSIINGTMLIWIPILAVLFLQEEVSTKEVFGLVVVAVGTVIVQLRQPINISSFFGRWRKP
jgi:drug/metabolite transporter (DMT)-like permease